MTGIPLTHRDTPLRREILALHHRKLAPIEIARRCNCARGYVYQVIEYENLRRLREMLKEQKTVAEIADELGIWKATAIRYAAKERVKTD
jgi:hypothetical protein